MCWRGWHGILVLRPHALLSHAGEDYISFYALTAYPHNIQLSHQPQLRDLPKMLLSKAEEDWRGQLRALRHAEWLIRASPDELPQYAGAAAWLVGHTYSQAVGLCAMAAIPSLAGQIAWNTDDMPASCQSLLSLWGALQHRKLPAALLAREPAQTAVAPV